MSDTLLSCCCKPCCNFYIIDGSISVVVSGWTNAICIEDDPIGWFRDFYDSANGSFSGTVVGGVASIPTGVHTQTFYSDSGCTSEIFSGDYGITLTIECNTSTGDVTLTWDDGGATIITASGNCPEATFTANNGVMATISIVL